MSWKIDNPLTYLTYFNFITLKYPFALLTSSCSTHQKSKLLLLLASFVMLRLQYETLYLLTCVTHHLFIHSPFSLKSTFSPILTHSLIHVDLTVNGWHRFDSLPISHVRICMGGELIATCNTERLHRRGLDREDVQRVFRGCSCMVVKLGRRKRLICKDSWERKIIWLGGYLEWAWRTEERVRAQARVRY